MKIKENTLCPCGSGKRFKFCCAQNTFLPESIERYEILSELLGQTVELGSSLLDTEEFREFCNNSVDQFRLLLDYDQHTFEEMLNSNIGCQLLMEWLIFLAPLALTMEELKNDLELAEALPFIDFLNTSGSDLIDSSKLAISKKEQDALKVTTDKVCRELVEDLSRSRLSVFCVEQELMNGLCVKDKISGEFHFLYDPGLVDFTPKSEIFIGRIIHTCNIKLLLSVYAVLPDGKSQVEILNSCSKWNDSIESENDFSVSDMQVNLLQILVHYLV